MIAVIIFIGVMSGVFTAAGLFALITSVGVINRFADVSGTSEHVFLYEECIIIGATAANAVYVLGIPVKIGMAGCIIFGLISGQSTAYIRSQGKSRLRAWLYCGGDSGRQGTRTACVLLIYVLILRCKTRRRIL